MADAHETYLIAQAVPGWCPPEEELSDFSLLVMARIHSIHKAHELKMLARIMGADGG